MIETRDIKQEIKIYEEDLAAYFNGNIYYTESTIEHLKHLKNDCAHGLMYTESKGDVIAGKDIEALLFIDGLTEMAQEIADDRKNAGTMVNNFFGDLKNSLLMLEIVKEKALFGWMHFAGDGSHCINQNDIEAILLLNGLTKTVQELVALERESEMSAHLN